MKNKETAKRKNLCLTCCNRGLCKEYVGEDTTAYECEEGYNKPIRPQLA